MPEHIKLTINGHAMSVKQGTSVAAAIMMAGAHCRNSVNGEPRTPFCGMGICFECRAIVDNIPHSRSCQMLCEPGMKICSQ